MTTPDPLVFLNSRAAGERPTCNEPDSAHCEKCQSCPGTCVCPATPELNPGRYRMSVDVEVDEHGLLYPHDTGAMHTTQWWQQRNASFTTAETHAAILAGRRNQLIETDRLRTQVQELRAEVNRLNRLHDERDAIERGRLNTKENS
jgi:hypothetical protein